MLDPDEKRGQRNGVRLLCGGDTFEKITEGNPDQAVETMS